MLHKANQIALFFASYPNDEAIAAIEDHLRKFWAPRMRAQIVNHVATTTEGLHPLALEAVRRLSATPPVAAVR